MYLIGEAPGWAWLATDLSRLFMDGQSHRAMGIAKLLTGHRHEPKRFSATVPMCRRTSYSWMDQQDHSAQGHGCGCGAEGAAAARSGLFHRPRGAVPPRYQLREVRHEPAGFRSAGVRRKAELFSILDEICQTLELSDEQLEAARTSYEAVAEWLSGSTNPLLRHIDVYAHGSAGLGTTVRPLDREDFDVDLICKVLLFIASGAPTELKKIVGDRLKENVRYADMLEEKKRCWRLNYAREYHLDISPTIVNPDVTTAESWFRTGSCASSSQPIQGATSLFERRVGLMPRLKMTKSITASDQANVEPFPHHARSKGILRRTVQLLKRHRDIHFQFVSEEVAPISILITTLAAQSYEYCVRNFAFDLELDVVVETIRLMPHFIDRPFVNGRRMYVVANETTIGENFAEPGIPSPPECRRFTDGMRRPSRISRRWRSSRASTSSQAARE